MVSHEFQLCVKSGHRKQLVEVDMKHIDKDIELTRLFNVILFIVMCLYERTDSVT